MIEVNVLDDEVMAMLLTAELALGEKALDTLLEKAALDIEKNAADRAPKDTGFLADSIHAVGASVEVGAEYAGYVEFGTEKMAAQPYLFPAVDEEVPYLERALRAAVEGGNSADN